MAREGNSAIIPAGTGWGRHLWGGLLDLVYPPRCLLCEQYDTPVICEACYALFRSLPDPVCAVCGRAIAEENAPCRLCNEFAPAGSWGFTLARSASVYEGALRHAIHRVKYHRFDILAQPLGEHLANRLVADTLIEKALLNTVALVVPAPVSRVQARRRGFNQAERLAAPVAEMLGVPVAPRLLARTGKQRAQVGLTGEARRRNLSTHSFAVTDPALVREKTVLLIDDVFTTGTTLSTCAHALRAAGAPSVLAVTLAGGA